MNKFFLMIAMLVSTLLMSCSSTKSDTQKAELSVRGNCGSCEKRIEAAAYDAGVKSASWSPETQTLVIYYNPSQTSPEKVAESVVAVGHEVNGKAVDDAVYNNLPACCQYKDGTHDEHMEHGKE